VDALDDLGQGIDVRCARDVIGGVLVVRADIDHHDVGGWVLLEVPWFRVIWDKLVACRQVPQDQPINPTPSRSDIPSPDGYITHRHT
jgi:hypothetical protein